MIIFLDLNITVDVGKHENIFNLSQYDELPDLEDYHSKVQNSLNLNMLKGKSCF